MSKNVKYVLFAVVLLFLAGIPLSHLVGQMTSTKTENQLLLTILCKDIPHFKAELDSLPIPPNSSKYTLPAVDNRAELWEAMKSASLSRCDSLELYPN